MSHRYPATHGQTKNATAAHAYHVTGSAIAVQITRPSGTLQSAAAGIISSVPPRPDFAAGDGPSGLMKFVPPSPTNTAKMNSAIGTPAISAVTVANRRASFPSTGRIISRVSRLIRHVPIATVFQYPRHRPMLCRHRPGKLTGGHSRPIDLPPALRTARRRLDPAQ